MGFLEALARIFGFKKREMKILIIGLDNSGKSTMLDNLKPQDQQRGHTVPTVGFNLERISVKPFIFTCFDMSGDSRYRNLWEHYYYECDAIIYVIDSADHLRLIIARDEIEQMLMNRAICGRRVPLLFLANKMDLHGALTASEIADALGLKDIRNKAWTIVPSNAVSGEGIQSAIKWLCDQLTAQPSQPHRRFN